MKILIICAVLSLCVAVSLAGPVQKKVRDEDDSSASAESGEVKMFENDSSSSEEEKEDKVQKIIIKDNSSDSSEELPEINEIIKDPINENTSVEDQELTDDFVISRAKRAVILAPHANNQLFAKDEQYSQQKRHRLALESSFQDSYDRTKRNADTSEEDSSEENKKDKNQAKGVDIGKKPESAPAETLELATKSDTAAAKGDAKAGDIRRKRKSPSSESSEENSSEEGKQEAPAKEVVVAKKPETAPSETLQLDAKPDAAPAESDHKSEALRRRRSTEDSSEEDQSRQAQDDNEVFILSKENQTDNEDNNNEDFDINEPEVLSDKIFDTPDSSSENKNSEEDYAQGCGGNRSDNSNENSNEKNETL